MKSFDYQLIGERKHFPKKLFVTEILCILFGSAIMLTDVFLMVFYYQKIVVSTIVLACIFACILVLCSIQIVVYSLCNKAKQEAILFDSLKDKYIITTLLRKEFSIDKKDIVDLKANQPLFGKNKSYGKLIISYKSSNSVKKISLSFLEDIASVIKKMSH